MDSQGDVFVANWGNNTVEKFNASGVLLQTLSNGVSTPSVTIDGNGNVWVANYGNSTLEEFGAASANASAHSAAVELLAVNHLAV